MIVHTMHNGKIVSVCPHVWRLEIAEQISSEPVGKLISSIFYWFVEFVMSWDANSHLVIKFPTI